MIGTRFAKPLEPDTLTRTVMRTETREVEEVVAYPFEHEITHKVQEPVYKTVTADDGEKVQILVGYTEKEVTETVQDVEYRTEKRIVAEEMPKQERYPNPAPNTYTKYHEASQWCSKNGARMVDSPATPEYPNGYYEVRAIPAPTPEERAAAELARAKAERAVAVAAIKVEVDGLTFDGDEKAQERMARAVLMAESPEEQTEWVLADNTVALVTADQLKRACRAAGKAQTALWTLPYEA